MFKQKNETLEDDSREAKSCIALIARALPILVFLSGWHFLAQGDIRFQFFAGSPAMVWDVAVKDLTSAEYYRHFMVTGLEAGVGLLLAMVAGVLVSIALLCSPRTEKIMGPYLVALGSVPVFALAPIIIWWLGVGWESKVFISFASAVLLCIMHAYQGFREVSAEYSKLARALGARRWPMIKIIILPGALNALSVTARSTASLALVGAFIGEFLSSTSGLGHYTLKASQLYDAPRTIFGVLSLAVLGGALARISAWGTKSLTSAIGG